MLKEAQHPEEIQGRVGVLERDKTELSAEITMVGL
jgi:hypothetical protein